jgi:hypothetical protein
LIEQSRRFPVTRQFACASVARFAITLLLALGIAAASGWSLIAGTTIVIADDDDDDWEEEDWDDDDDRHDNRGRGSRDDDDDDAYVRSGGNKRTGNGEALILHPAATVTPAKTPVGETSIPQTGGLRILAFRCADRPAGNDWAEHCTVSDSGAWFSVAPKHLLNEISTTRRVKTDATGEISVESLATGRYELDRVDGDWCYAEATQVDDDGNVIILTGETTEVWVYTCRFARE